MGVMEENMCRRYFANEKGGKKGTPPDRQSQESSEAIAAGVSYGKYKAAIRGSHAETGAGTQKRGIRPAAKI